jgi:hypothetical protein
LNFAAAMLPAMSPSPKSFSASLYCAQQSLLPNTVAILLDLLDVSVKKSEVGGRKQFSEGQLCQASERQANAGNTSRRIYAKFSALYLTACIISTFNGGCLQLSRSSFVFWILLSTFAIVVSQQTSE